MLIKGCFYCGDIALGIDRIDSNLDHMPENCVACCYGCNISKGASDPYTFIRKAYYRVNEKYYDNDTNIWFTIKNKPIFTCYKRRANKNGVLFDLTEKDFDVLIKSACKYCRRPPDTWFGIDREIPSLGYVIGNVVPCCWDCNNDKSVDDVQTMKNRNEWIVKRVDDGKLVVNKCEKTILHHGVNNTSKKVCARGNMYSGYREASRALGMNNNYISVCIRAGTHSGDIFEITNEFYEEHKDSDMYITKDMFNAFDHFYVNE